MGSQESAQVSPYFWMAAYYDTQYWFHKWLADFCFLVKSQRRNRSCTGWQVTLEAWQKLKIKQWIHWPLWIEQVCSISSKWAFPQFNFHKRRKSMCLNDYADAPLGYPMDPLRIGLSRTTFSANVKSGVFIRQVLIYDIKFCNLQEDPNMVQQWPSTQNPVWVGRQTIQRNTEVIYYLSKTYDGWSTMNDVTFSRFTDNNFNTWTWAKRVKHVRRNWCRYDPNWIELKFKL